MDRMLGTVRDQFGIGINGAHMLFRPGVEKFHGVLPFATNDVVGCGIFTPQQKTKNGNELLGNKQNQKSTIFFTVNGEIMGKSKSFLYNYFLKFCSNSNPVANRAPNAPLPVC